MNFNFRRRRACYVVSYFLMVAFSFAASEACSQNSTGLLQGTVLDGSTYKPLYRVALKVNEGTKNDSSFGDGSYRLRLPGGHHNVTFQLAGFQSKTISGILVKKGEFQRFNVLLYPVSADLTGKKIRNDSIADNIGGTNRRYKQERNLATYNFLRYRSANSDAVLSQNIDPGLEKNSAQLTKLLLGVVAQEDFFSPTEQFVTVSGMGERYNQVFLNGSSLNPISAMGKSFALNAIPVEALERVSLSRTTNGSYLADFAGGNIGLRLRDMPARNFFYLRVEGGIGSDELGKDFYGSQRNHAQFFSFPGRIRSLPADFPTSRSMSPFENRTPDQQVQLAMKLKNNLAPVNYGKGMPNDRLILGVGRVLDLKNNRKLGFTLYLQQAKSQLITGSTLQQVPDLLNNPYPFAPNVKLINTQSNDINYSYNSLFSGVLHANYLYKRSKLSFTTVLASLFDNLYINRTQFYKPDEDTLAHVGLYYKPTHKVSLFTQLAGEHALGSSGNFKLSWQAAHTYSNETTDDERSFSFRQDPFDAARYEIAQVSAPPLNTDPLSADPAAYDPNLTNSGRLWRKLSENSFEGAINLGTPFNLFHQAQYVRGGVYLQSRYHVLTSTLLSAIDSGYHALDDLLAPERYQTGGLQLKNYFVNTPSTFPNSRGNYNGSSNIGATYINLENKLTKSLSLEWGTRLEAASLLVSNFYYSFAAESKATIAPLDKNNFVSQIDFLPFAGVKYQLRAIQFSAGYFKSLNRPQLQELTSYRYYDARLFTVTIGNPYLQRALINNFNAAISWIPRSETSLSLSGFYKTIDQPIERLMSNYTASSMVMQAVNMPSATVQGMTAEIKLSGRNLSHGTFLSNWLLFGNATVLNTNVKPGYVRFYQNPVPGHSLSGSPDYTYNAGLQFSKDGFPAFSVVYSGYGDYIYSVGYGTNLQLNNGATVTSTPNFRVKANQQLDIQISEKLFKKRLQVIAGVNNVLNNRYVMYQDLNGNNKFDDPLRLQNNTTSGGYYLGGTDNTITSIKYQQTFYLSFSYRL